MAISKLSLSFVDGSTVIDANKMNALVSKINELVDKANGSTSGGGGTDSGGGSDTPQPESRPNLFVASTAKQTAISSQTGAEVELDNFYTSDFISVKPLTKYSWWVRHVVVWFDANKNFISSSPSSESTTRTLVSPENAAFCRFSFNGNAYPMDTIVMKEGERDWV